MRNNKVAWQVRPAQCRCPACQCVATPSADQTNLRPSQPVPHPSLQPLPKQQRAQATCPAAPVQLLPLTRLLRPMSLSRTQPPAQRSVVLRSACTAQRSAEQHGSAVDAPLLQHSIARQADLLAG